MSISIRTLALCALCASAVLGIGTLSAHDAESGDHRIAHRPPAKRSPLVDKVRAATYRYKDIKVAIAEGWVPATPCVSGPNSGAMGIHYVLPERIGDGAVDASAPEALIYEPLGGGRFSLVGVEFIVIAADWDTGNPGAQPSVDGHLMNLVPAPNRYRLPAFYELHVWAWEGNPDGAFADWNPVVSCEQQATP